MYNIQEMALDRSVLSSCYKFTDIHSLVGPERSSYRFRFGWMEDYFFPTSTSHFFFNNMTQEKERKIAVKVLLIQLDDEIKAFSRQGVGACAHLSRLTENVQPFIWIRFLCRCWIDSVTIWQSVPSVGYHPSLYLIDMWRSAWLKSLLHSRPDRCCPSNQFGFILWATSGCGQPSRRFGQLLF